VVARDVASALLVASRVAGQQGGAGDEVGVLDVDLRAVVVDTSFAVVLVGVVGTVDAELDQAEGLLPGVEFAHRGCSTSAVDTFAVEPGPVLGVVAVVGDIAVAAARRNVVAATVGVVVGRVEQSGHESSRPDAVVAVRATLAVPRQEGPETCAESALDVAEEPAGQGRYWLTLIWQVHAAVVIDLPQSVVEGEAHQVGQALPVVQQQQLSELLLRLSELLPPVSIAEGFLAD